MYGMRRKGLFNCIIIAKGEHCFVYLVVRITGYDVTNKYGTGQEELGDVKVYQTSDSV